MRVEGGCLWGDVDHATHPFGLAVPSGFLSTTGVGGLTLGGGIGYLARQYGLTIDNLLGVDVVLADGRLVTASAEENADLFWAVRGGGGNFGVVTSFLFQGAPIQNVYGGPIFWSMDNAAQRAPHLARLHPEGARGPERLVRLRDRAAGSDVPGGAPHEEGGGRHLVLHGRPGEGRRGLQADPPVRAAAHGLLRPDPVPGAAEPLRRPLPAGLQWYWKADFFQELTDKAIDLHLKYAERLPSPHSTMHLYPINGAAARVKKGDTAFSFRDANFAEVIVGVDPDPAQQPAPHPVGQGLLAGAAPVLAGRRLHQHDDGRGRGQREGVYRDNYARLAQVKKKYDPTNLFRVNQNIKPA